MILNLRWFICRQLVARNKLRNMGLHNLGNFEMSPFHVFVWWHRHAYSYIPYIINASFYPGPFFAVGFPGESSTHSITLAQGGLHGSLEETSQSYSNPIPTYMKILKMYSCMSFLLQVIIPRHGKFKGVFHHMGRHVVWTHTAQRKIPRPYSVVISSMDPSQNKNMFWRKDLKRPPKSK